MLITSDKPIFIDSYWDPFWTFEKQYYTRFYTDIMNKVTTPPDISFFLKVDEAVAQKRAQARTPDAQYDFDTNTLKQKRRDFVDWAKRRVPNFYTLRADVPVADVFNSACNIIKEVVPQLRKDVPVSDASPTAETKKIVSLRKRSIQKRI